MKNGAIIIGVFEHGGKELNNVQALADSVGATRVQQLFVQRHYGLLIQGRVSKELHRCLQKNWYYVNVVYGVHTPKNNVFKIGSNDAISYYLAREFDRSLLL